MSASTHMSVGERRGLPAEPRLAIAVSSNISRIAIAANRSRGGAGGAMIGMPPGLGALNRRSEWIEGPMRQEIQNSKSTRHRAEQATSTKLRENTGFPGVSSPLREKYGFPGVSSPKMRLSGHAVFGDWAFFWAPCGGADNGGGV